MFELRAHRRSWLTQFRNLEEPGLPEWLKKKKKKERETEREWWPIQCKQYDSMAHVTWIENFWVITSLGAGLEFSLVAHIIMYPSWLLLGAQRSFWLANTVSASYIKYHSIATSIETSEVSNCWIIDTSPIHSLGFSQVLMAGTEGRSGEE